MATSSDQENSSSNSLATYTSFLNDKFREWESTLQRVVHAGCAQSELYLYTNNVKVFVEDGKIYYQGPDKGSETSKGPQPNTK